MTPILPTVGPPGARQAIYGTQQPEYDPLPAVVDPSGLVLTEWVPSDAERAHLAAGGHFLLWIFTYGNPLQPVVVETDLRTVKAEGSSESSTDAKHRYVHAAPGAGTTHDAVMDIGRGEPD